jgi:translation initiation factor 1
VEKGSVPLRSPHGRHATVAERWLTRPIGDRVADDKPFHNPFEVLGRFKPSLPRPSAPAPTPEKDETEAPQKTIARAVVRIERSGRGGKEVTVVEHLSLSPKDREAWLKALKAALGCGGVVENESLVLQGDQRKRLPAILMARGVRKVTVA